ncbi:MAG: VWA domain-containing protein [Chloroflexi bacterium]|nr:VWA domain-containing protein [Chloroflexota bacterium]
MTLPFSVTAPEVLLVGLLLIGATLLLSAAARHHLSRGRRRTSLFLRATMLSLLVLALAGLQLALPVDRQTTVFVVDLSDSVGADGQSSALAFVREALEERPGGDQAAVVAFGRDALVERLPAELEDIDRIASVPTKSATDIGGALRLASALFPDETQKRIVLISDGNDTTGRGQAEAALASSRGIRIETYVVGLAGADEVILQRLHTPATARVGEEIEAEVTISSTVRQPATVRLYGDGRQIGVESVTLQPGLTRVVFTVEATEAGFHTFRAVVEAEQDTFSQNDRADSDTVVKGDPRILLVTGDPAVSANLASALEAERQDVTQLAPEQIPTDLAALATYDSIVLVDVPAERLGEARMTALQVYVRDVGRGLVMIGGEESFGAGGYSQTPLEEALPVDMEVRDRERQPDVALVVVIDKSGSMDACHCNTADRDMGTAITGIPKVDIGKEAILRAVAALTARDEFGVVSFNENAHWVIHTAPLGQVGDVEGQIAGIRPEGQTNIFAGLTAAVEELEQTTATRRHIVLLTDGWSSSGAYEDLLIRMRAANITLSAVGAGGGGANEFLSGLAEQGGGRYYPAVNPASIPDIFLKETQQVSGQQIVEESFFPIQTAESPILRGLEEGLPRLLGYNGTTPKPAAQTVLVSSRDDPVLAQWQYGLGRAVAWTSDATARWATNWVPWAGFNRFFSQLVSWTFPGEEADGLEAEFITEGDETTLRLRSVESDGTTRDFYETMARLTSPEIDSLGVRLDQVAPGTYEAPLGTLAPGAYAIRLDQTRAGETPLSRTVVLVAPTPAEYRLLGTNERLLAVLRGATGGRALETGAQAWTRDLAATTASRDLWPWLLLFALLLWPLDVAVRRVSVGRRDLALARAGTDARWRAWRGPSGRTAQVGGMLAAKDRAAGSRARAALYRQETVEGTTTDTADGSPTAEAPPPSTPSAATVPATAAPPAASPPPDTLARLRDARDRARRR